MFNSLKTKLLLGLYVFLLISIPIGAYLVSQNQTVKSKASEPKTITKTAPKQATSSARQILGDLSSQLDSSPIPQASSSGDSSSPTVATSFGPTLSLKATLEGRPIGSQATKLFVGIVEGVLSSNPKFLLSFTVDLPESGTYSNLSLAGLNTGSTYTALIKGASQIATSSAFVMSPAATNLNGGEALNMLSGDLNQDNVINDADYSILQKSYGASPSSSNWNPLADFNQDGIINSFDLTIVSRNQGKIGASGTWTSPLPKTATSSGGLSPQGSAEEGGYWIFIPK